MKAVLLSARDGTISVEDVPPPLLEPGFVLIRNDFSLISAGTERATVDTGAQNLIGKARQRPDQVRQVLDNVRRDGLRQTYRVVQDRLDRPMQLGYSCAGTVIGRGTGVDVAVGTRVAAAGAGYATHCEIVAVPKNLVVPIPQNVPAESAAFSTVGAIALHGIHQAEAPPGSRVAVIGLGLVGQLTIRLLKAYGYDVVGVDLNPHALELAQRADVASLPRAAGDLPGQLRRLWGGGDADAVLITAATHSSDPIDLAGQIARDRATVVVVGDVAVLPQRASYYRKELDIRYSRSYGPGRYDPAYEERGADYPIAYVPWTERRNLSEFLRVLASGGMDLGSLDPHVVPVDQAAAAYAELRGVGEARHVAILLSYAHAAGELDGSTERQAVEPRPRPWTPARGKIRVAAIGAGNFATKMLFPHIAAAPDASFAWLTTGHGISAVHQGKRWKFEAVMASAVEGLASDSADAVLITSRHDSHAEYLANALSAGLTVFCEKPIGLSDEELEAVAAAYFDGASPAMAGFNRRFAPAIRDLQQVLPDGPSQLVYRVFAGKLPADHWYFDPRQGGRLLGEVCHFIDTASYLLQARPVAVECHGLGSADPALVQSMTLAIRYDNSSVATVVYSGATSGRAPKEMIEVASNDMAARIDDFRTLDTWTSSKHTYKRYRGGPKGHQEEMAAFLALARGEKIAGADFDQALASSLTATRAADSLRTGRSEAVVARTPALTRALTGR